MFSHAVRFEKLFLLESRKLGDGTNALISMVADAKCSKVWNHPAVYCHIDLRNVASDDTIRHSPNGAQAKCESKRRRKKKKKKRKKN